MRTGKMTSESGSNGKSSNDSTPYSSLRRDASLIIPSMIPTQEVLRNLNYYRGNGMIQLNGDEDEEERNNDNKNHSNDSQDHVLSTHTDTPNSSTQSANTTLTPRRVSASESSVSYQFSSPQPSRPPRALRTYSRKRAITPPPPPPPVKLQSDGEDSDPIMDFDDSDEGEGGFGSGSSLTAHQHSLSKAQLANPPHSTHQPLVPPESPSRRFIIPPATQPVRGNSHRQSSTAALRARREKPAPESPSKRLRPLSEIPRPVVPKHIQLQQSPSKRSTSSNSSGSPRKQRTSKTNPPSGSASPSPSKTPSRAIGTTGFTPNMISHKALRPPAALGPQLLQIASEITNNCSEEDREQEEQDTLVRRRWKKNTEPVVADQDSLFLDDTGMALMTSDFFSEPQMGSPEIEPKPEPLSPTSSSILGKGSRKDVSESPFWVPNSPTISSSKTTGLVRVKKEESLTLALTVSKKELAEEPMMPQQSLQRREKQPIKEQPLPSEIPLPSLVLEYTPKLTPLDHIKWPPAKVGRFHILVLVIFINPEEQVVTKKGETVAKREINVCDQSATSFKLNLWGDCCKWADTQFKVGDAILITVLL
ncbi:hypothetical protein BGZ46_004174 [Entomortierella lignicola]|nr:hypothetical protein BGZ46_004174 [Entomortierella lignicola]